MDRKSEREREEGDDYSYLNLQQFHSPIIANSNLRSINPKNSDQPINLPDSHQTSFNFDPELFRSPHNLYNLSNKANEKEIEELKRAAAQNLKMEFMKKDQHLKKKRKYSDQFNIDDEVDRKKKISKNKEDETRYKKNPLQHKEHVEKVIPMITPIMPKEQSKIFDKDFNFMLTDQSAHYGCLVT